MRLNEVNNTTNKMAVFSFGRLNPPHFGHHAMINTLQKVAKEKGADWYLFVSSKTGDEKNPLTYDQKVWWIQTLFPETVGHLVIDSNIKTPLIAATWLYKKGYRSATFVAGEDDMGSYSEMIKSGNAHGIKNPDSVKQGKGYIFDPLEFAISPRLASATNARKNVQDNDPETFVRSILGHKINPKLAELVHDQLFPTMRKAMGLGESIEEAKRRKTPWERMAAPFKGTSKDLDKRAERSREDIERLKQLNKDYQAILDRDKDKHPKKSANEDSDSDAEERRAAMPKPENQKPTALSKAIMNYTPFGDVDKIGSAINQGKYKDAILPAAQLATNLIPGKAAATAASTAIGIARGIADESEDLNKRTPGVRELAQKYMTTPAAVHRALARGIKVEFEHTDDIEVASEIAMDHLGERLDYYIKLAKIENESDDDAVAIPGEPVSAAMSRMNARPDDQSKANFLGSYMKSALDQGGFNNGRFAQHTDNLKKKIGENFADGKGPGKPGDSQRHGIPKGATIAELEKAAKATGRKGQLARWQLNMRRGKKKANEEITNEEKKPKKPKTIIDGALKTLIAKGRSEDEAIADLKKEIDSKFYDLSENWTPLELAIMEGGHLLDEHDENLEETLKKVKGKWALVSRHDPKKVLQYYHGSQHPSKEWVNKVERRVHSFESIVEDEETVKPRVYLDMDGVLADFFGEWSRISGVDHYKDIDDVEAKLQLVRDHTTFWVDLPLLPHAKALIKTVVAHYGEYRICSKPLEGDTRSKQGKLEWIRTHLSDMPPAEIILTADKAEYATANGFPNILVDDFGKNISSWRAAGGIGIKYEDASFAAVASILTKLAKHGVSK
jgi:5'(3')-deoxyribonucleotidase